MFSVGLTAKDIMTSPVVTVTDAMSLNDASQLLLNRMISGAPVVNASGSPVGVITLKDIVRKEPKTAEAAELGADYVLKPGQTESESQTSSGSTNVTSVHDVMTPYIYRVEEDTSVLEIARIMTMAHIHRLFVSDGNEIIGVVSALDMLKSYAGLKAAAAA